MPFTNQPELKSLWRYFLTNGPNAQDSCNHGIGSVTARAQDVDSNGAAYRTLASNCAKAIGELSGL
jgi:hypothetical protein